MDANDSTPPKGENVSAESYSLKCWSTGETWVFVGSLDETIKCPHCGRMTPVFEARFWFVACEDQVEVSIPELPEDVRQVILRRAEADPEPEASIRDDLCDILSLPIEKAVEDLSEEVSE